MLGFFLKATPNCTASKMVLESDSPVNIEYCLNKHIQVSPNGGIDRMLVTRSINNSFEFRFIKVMFSNSCKTSIFLSDAPKAAIDVNAAYSIQLNKLQLEAQAWKKRFCIAAKVAENTVTTSFYLMTTCRVTKPAMEFAVENQISMYDAIFLQRHVWSDSILIVGKMLKLATLTSTSMI